MAEFHNDFDLFLDEKTPQPLFSFPNGIFTTNPFDEYNEFEEKNLILSGSFNPLHHGHIKLLLTSLYFVRYFGVDSMSLSRYKTCLETNQLPLPSINWRPSFEISIQNYDKLQISSEELHSRIGQFIGKFDLFLTKKALFEDKSEIFPNSVFILGYDTAYRFLHARHYTSEQIFIQTLERIQRNNCKFIIAGRLGEGNRFMNFGANQELDCLRNRPDLCSLFIPLPKELFREDISSTQLRQQSRA